MSAETIQISSTEETWVNKKTEQRATWVEYKIGETDDPLERATGVIKYLNIAPEKSFYGVNFLKKACTSKGKGWFAARVYEKEEPQNIAPDDRSTNLAVWGETEEEVEELIRSAEKMAEEAKRTSSLRPMAGGAGALGWKGKALTLALAGVVNSVKAIDWIVDKGGHVKDKIPPPSRRGAAVGIAAGAALLAGVVLWQGKPAGENISTPIPSRPQPTQGLPPEKEKTFKEVFPEVPLANTNFPQPDTYYLNNPDIRSGNYSSLKGACEGYDASFSGIPISNYQVDRFRQALLHDNRVNGCRYATYLLNETEDFHLSHQDLVNHFVDSGGAVPCSHERSSSNCTLNIIRIPDIGELFAFMDKKTEEGEIFSVLLPR